MTISVVRVPDPLSETKRLRSEVTRRDLRIRCYALLLAVDLICIFGSFSLSGFIRFGEFRQDTAVALPLAIMPIFIGMAFYGDAYSITVLTAPRRGVLRVAGALLFTLSTLLFISYCLKLESDISRLYTGFALVFSIVSVAIVRSVVGRGLVSLADGRFTTDVVIVDGKVVPVPEGVRLVDAELSKLKPNLRDPVLLHRIADELYGADRVVVACDHENSVAWSTILKGANVRGEILVEGLDQLAPLGVGNVGDRTTLLVAIGPLDFRQRFLKRLFDLVLTIPALVIIAPVLAVIAFAIKLDSPGPVLFKQTRMGHGNSLFHVFKFRTMRAQAADELGIQSTIRGDGRVTRVGRLLRKTSVDELPQLFNVLCGSMSIVGPRPHALGSLAGDELFWEIDDRYWHRHALKPGITGLAQVRGYRGATHHRDDLSRRLQADLEYLSGWSILRDVAIIFRTVRVVVHSNAY